MQETADIRSDAANTQKAKAAGMISLLPHNDLTLTSQTLRRRSYGTMDVSVDQHKETKLTRKNKSLTC